jgi:hypothetical protein
MELKLIYMDDYFHLFIKCNPWTLKNMILQLDALSPFSGFSFVGLARNPWHSELKEEITI